MADFLLTTDTSCDIFRSELEKSGVPWIPLTFNIDGETFEDDFSDNVRYKEFYQKIRDGAMPTTSQINEYNHEEFFKKAIDGGAENIIHIPLSRGLSGTYESAKAAAARLCEINKGVSIHILDTKAATQGNRYILERALELRDGGASFADAIEKLTDISSRLHHWIIVDDLHHLRRGGRVSAASAYVGSLLKIKPILVINSEGGLSVVKKCKGITSAYYYVLDMAKKYSTDFKNNTIVLANADADDKLRDMEMIFKENTKAEIKRGWIGPVIGAHTGPGVIGVVFEGKKRLN